MTGLVAGALAAVLTVALATAAPAAAALPQPPPPSPRPPAAAPGTTPVPPAVTAAGAVVYSPDDGSVLVDVAAGVPRPPASTTKIMTALLAIEAGTLDDVVTVSPTAAAAGTGRGIATLGLRPGGQLPMRDLLAGLVIRSGNDAAVAVAEHVAGSEAAFVQRMNARAAELGLPATRFVNASGLTDDPAHVASPLDLARLGATAMSVPDFAAWAGADVLAVPGLGLLENRNELIGTYPGATGVKTGYLRIAGECLVASATRDGRTLVAVVLGSADSSRDAAALLDHGFAAYRRAVPASPAAAVATYRWGGGEAPLVTADVLDATLPAGATATWRTVLDPVVPVPAPRGTPLGHAELVVGGTVVDSVELRAGADMTAPDDAAPAGTRVGSALEDTLRAFARTVPGERAA